MDAEKNAYTEHVINAFEKFSRKVIDNASKDFERQRQTHPAKTPLPESWEFTPNELILTDHYPAECCSEFKVLEAVVFVHNAPLAAALDALSERKRNVVLLYYFFGMTDKQIGEALKTMRKTVNKIRNQSIHELETLIGNVID